MTPTPATAPGPPERPGHGLVLVRGSAGASARWLRKGLVAVATHELGGWTGITLVEERARSAPPYDCGLEVLAARPVPTRRRPAIGLFDIDGCAVVTVQPKGWRAEQRWLVWEPGVGPRRTPDLPPLPVAMIVATAGGSARVHPSELAALLRRTTGEPVDLLAAVLALLHLPGADLLHRPTGGTVVEPSASTVRRFDELVADDHGGGA